MDGYKASEASIKHVLNKAMLKNKEYCEFSLRDAENQLEILLDRPAHDLPPIPFEKVEAVKQVWEHAIGKARFNVAQISLDHLILEETLNSGTLQDVRDVIESNGMYEAIQKGLESLVFEFRHAKHYRFEERMSEPGFMDQLCSDVEKWGTRRDEYNIAIERLDIQAAGDWLSGKYFPEDTSSEQTRRQGTGWAVPTAVGREHDLWKWFDEVWKDSDWQKEMIRYSKKEKGGSKDKEARKKGDTKIAFYKRLKSHLILLIEIHAKNQEKKVCDIVAMPDSIEKPFRDWAKNRFSTSLFENSEK